MVGTISGQRDAFIIISKKPRVRRTKLSKNLISENFRNVTHVYTFTTYSLLAVAFDCELFLCYLFCRELFRSYASPSHAAALRTEDHFRLIRLWYRHYDRSIATEAPNRVTSPIYAAKTSNPGAFPRPPQEGWGGRAWYQTFVLNLCFLYLIVS